MSEPTFVREEDISAEIGTIALNRRLFASLPLFLKLLPLSLLAILLSSAAPSVFRWYSGQFSSGAPPQALPFPGLSLTFQLRGMIAITAAAVFFRIAAWALFEMSGMWASQRIHAEMVAGLSGTRTTYFDENPSGRLINRLIRDYDEVRTTAIIFVGDFLNATVEVLSIALVACFASPWAALFVVPLLVAFGYVQYQRSGMLEHARAFSAVATSQVIGRKTDLIEGREIFLLYGRADRLLERMARSFRDYVRASALTVHIETWASLWIRVSAEFFSLVVLLLVIAALRHGRLDAALAGVIISSLFGITGSIGWLDFATSLISRSAPHIRRVFALSDLPAEEHEEKDAQASADRKRGVGSGQDGLAFVDYSMSYRKDTAVTLENLNLTIARGQKVALVGRTGSGKTSVVQALLRMVYVRGGDIRWNGESIFEQDAREWRRRFGVVPQSPYLFEGTIASNLDRTGTIPEEKLRAALEAVGLRYDLSFAVSEGGQNLSLGERQLICLARVIAADREIILMDEPTSGLDPETDARVTALLRTAFKDRTLLTIAHRKESLVHYDRVIEMKAGKVAL